MSKREDIVTSLLATLEATDGFNHVERRLPTYEQLRQFAVTQFPVICVVAGLPVPDEKLSSRAKGSPIDKVISNLDIELFVYVLDNEDADATISDKLEKIWVSLLADESQGGLVLGTTLNPERDVEFWHPYAAFKVTVSVRYVHTKGGI